MEAVGRRYLKTEYFIRACEAPEDYGQVTAAWQGANQGGSGNSSGRECENTTAGAQFGSDQPKARNEGAAAAGCKLDGPGLPSEKLLPVGVTTYTQLLSNAELSSIEAQAGEQAPPHLPARRPAPCHCTHAWP